MSTDAPPSSGDASLSHRVSLAAGMMQDIDPATYLPPALARLSQQIALSTGTHATCNALLLASFASAYLGPDVRVKVSRRHPWYTAACVWSTIVGPGGSGISRVWKLLAAVAASADRLQLEELLRQLPALAVLPTPHGMIISGRTLPAILHGLRSRSGQASIFGSDNIAGLLDVLAPPGGKERERGNALELPGCAALRWDARSGSRGGSGDSPHVVLAGCTRDTHMAAMMAKSEEDVCNRIAFGFIKAKQATLSQLAAPRGGIGLIQRTCEPSDAQGLHVLADLMARLDHNRRLPSSRASAIAKGKGYQPTAHTTSEELPDVYGNALHDEDGETELHAVLLQMLLDLHNLGHRALPGLESPRDAAAALASPIATPPVCGPDLNNMKVYFVGSLVDVAAVDDREEAASHKARNGSPLNDPTLARLSSFERKRRLAPYLGPPERPPSPPSALPSAAEETAYDLFDRAHRQLNDLSAALHAAGQESARSMFARSTNFVLELALVFHTSEWMLRHPGYRCAAADVHSLPPPPRRAPPQIISVAAMRAAIELNRLCLRTRCLVLEELHPCIPLAFPELLPLIKGTHLHEQGHVEEEAGRRRDGSPSTGGSSGRDSGASGGGERPAREALVPHAHVVATGPTLSALGADPSPDDQVLLLDLPTELLLEVLRGSPRSVRRTCRTFRALVDGRQRTLSLWPGLATVRRRLQHFSDLLRSLPSLEALHVNALEFYTLAFLTACTTLASLTLADAPHLRDPSLVSLGLAACQRITFLDITGCRALPSIDPLSRLTALRHLNMRTCDHIKDIAPLVHCPHIAALALGVNVTSLGPLTALTSLASLNCGSLAVTDLRPLAACAASLTRLHFSGTPITDLSPLSRTTRLASLTLDDASNLLSLAPLARCGGALSHLHLRRCPVQDLTPLAACTALATLVLQQCPNVASLAPLASLGRSLTSLRLLQTSGVFDISPLASCTALEYLDLSQTCVASAAPLFACTRLAVLRVAGCGISQQQLGLLESHNPLLRVDRACAETVQ